MAAWTDSGYAPTVTKGTEAMPTALNAAVIAAPCTRRQWLARGALACLGFGLAQTLWTRRLFADPATSEFERWLADLLAAGEALKRGDITTPQWQARMDGLYGSVSLHELRAHIDFDRLTQRFDFTANGERFIDFDPLSGEGFADPPPERDRVVTMLAGVRRGKSVPPHGHENMTSAFLVLHGEFDVKQYDKLKTNAESLVFRQSRDERQGPGAWSSTSETLRNLHWLQASSGDAFFFSTKLVHIVADAPMKGRVN
ncbi:MAG: hypothetical protein EHM68_10020, partial [Lysobacterales bacterium]